MCLQLSSGGDFYCTALHDATTSSSCCQRGMAQSYIPTVVANLICSATSPAQDYTKHPRMPVRIARSSGWGTEHRGVGEETRRVPSPRDQDFDSEEQTRTHLGYARYFQGVRSLRHHHIPKNKSRTCTSCMSAASRSATMIELSVKCIVWCE